MPELEKDNDGGAGVFPPEGEDDDMCRSARSSSYGSMPELVSDTDSYGSSGESEMDPEEDETIFEPD